MTNETLQEELERKASHLAGTGLLSSPSKVRCWKVYCDRDRHLGVTAGKVGCGGTSVAAVWVSLLCF